MKKIIIAIFVAVIFIIAINIHLNISNNNNSISVIKLKNILALAANENTGHNNSNSNESGNYTWGYTKGTLNKVTKITVGGNFSIGTSGADIGGKGEAEITPYTCCIKSDHRNGCNFSLEDDNKVCNQLR
ncbi:hypothetical protein D0T49_05870 [Paludibacter sp. 221]|uniref:NVEALA domain-containing protein n=1 Tax=Paludibacter sp. 221 TaxID=2302939 RepID=UPI0013D04DA1|nr:hypothetical protein [Paludibacter sp. 221]NDV46569.1 hypothetical protein [Paludibacter sp. 221]